MSHHIYTTEGFVLGSIPRGEASAFLFIFTKGLGLVGASARSVRAPSSKLRYALQDFCFSTISFVRGKHEWKITNALPEKNYQHIFNDTTQNGREKLRITAHAFSLIKKLVVGEEKNEPLFSVLKAAFSFLEENTHNDDRKDYLIDAECILMLRIVHNLGYISPTPELNHFLLDTSWNSELIESMSQERTKAIAAINKAIKESQL